MTTATSPTLSRLAAELDDPPVMPPGAIAIETAHDEVTASPTGRALYLAHRLSLALSRGLVIGLALAMAAALVLPALVGPPDLSMVVLVLTALATTHLISLRLHGALTRRIDARAAHLLGVLGLDGPALMRQTLATAPTTIVDYLAGTTPRARARALDVG